LLKLSVSSLETFDKCPKKYHYRYIEKPDVDEKKWGHTEFGSCAHKILENFHLAIMKGDVSPEQYSSLMKKSFIDGVKDFDIEILEEPTWSPEGDKVGVKYLREIMQNYLDLIRRDGAPNVIGIEMPFNFSLDDKDSFVMRGFIDRVDRVEEGVYRVVDYKTSKDGKYLSGFQLLVYAEALRRKFPDLKKVYGSYMLLKHNCKTIDFEYSLDDIENCRKTLIKKAGLIDNELIWVKKPSALCKFCDYSKLCEGSWAEDDES